MNIKGYIFSENIKEIETLIKSKFKKELKTTFGHSNFPFTIKNVNINKFKRVFVAAVLDERIIEGKSEVNYSGLRESRKIKRSDIDIFSYERDDRTIVNNGKIIEYRVDKTNETIGCGTCKGNKQITCSTCSGNGKNRCGTCNGQRQVKCSVWGCRGGDVKCMWCSGKGTKTEGYGDDKRTVRCSCNNGYNKCSSCNNGYNTCSTCNGNGEVSCSTCGSSGKVDCYSCDAQGSFTNYLSVKSVLVQKKSDLVVSGNNPGDFISKNLIAEEFPFMNDFAKYKISELADYKPQIKELFTGLLPNKKQEGCMLYASLDECASLTFEISVGDSIYLGKLKNGALWFDESVMSLLFYDVIDGMVVDSKFKNLLSNKAAFDGNLSDTKKVWESIKEYHKFETIITSNDNTSAKINNTRKLNLLDNTVFLNHLYKKYINKEKIIKTIFTVFMFFIVFIITKIVGIGRYSNIVLIDLASQILIPIVFLLLTLLITKKLIQSWSPLSVSILGFCFILFGFWANNILIHSYEIMAYVEYLDQERLEEIGVKEPMDLIEKYKTGEFTFEQSSSLLKDEFGWTDEDVAEWLFSPEVDDALTPTLVESKDSNKMLDAVPDEYIDYSNKYIKSKKAYFYSYPNKESRLRSYVVMGDNIQYDSLSLVNGFYNSKFINSNNGVTTSGWIHQDAIFPEQKTLIDGSSLTEKLPKKELIANINVDKLNFRSSPEISDNIIGMLMLDDRVVFIDSISIDLPKIENGTLNKNITIEHNGQDYAFNKNKVVKINGKEGVYQLDVNISLGDGRELSNVILPITDLNLEKKQVWAKIEQGNKTGYVYYRFLNFDGQKSANNFDHSASVSYIKINDPDGYTNVREGKSSSTKIIYQIYDENKLFELLDDSGNWWKIKLDSSETKTSTGFIYKSKVIRVSNSKKH
jgi:hypothetical protein